MRSMCLWLACAGAVMAEVHPRLWFREDAEGAVKQRIANDPLARDVQAHIVKRAEKVLDERTCEYRIPDGKRLLSESRLALHNVLHCGWVWRTTGDVRFKERTIRELDAACALKDWNPSHFLDTAEMATAVAVGYDWLFPALSDEQKRRYEDALLEKALRVVGEKHAKTGWWKGATNNWTQVCGTGMALAAEVVKERDPALCEPLVEHGKKQIESCESFYLPDGAYPEGPSYWHYGTNYEVLLLAQLGKGIKVPEVLRRSGDFMRHVTGPTRVTFNYADGNPGAEVPSPAQSWIATHFKDVEQAAHVRSLLERSLKEGTGNGTTGDLRFFPLHLLWLPEAPGAGKTGPGYLGARFNGEQSFAFLRTAWTPDAAWLAVKGGTGAASHGHLDAGAFVYEAKGVRWFHDIGKDDYNMPGYFGNQRWDYLRLNNLSHNTLVIDGKLQATPREGCTVSEIFSGNSKLGVVVKLAPAYQGQAQVVDRSFTFDLKDGSVRTYDIVTKPVGPVRWAVVTKAKPKIEGSRVTLEVSGKRLVLERHDKAGGVWEEYSLKPKTEREQQNKGFYLIGFSAPRADELKLEVSWKVE
ncbi:heparinase II/III-family protein [Luteolibacter arcticus]|uniref:Heparinase II/III-family protein n=1 Tax=Luteolibacter arcticus TaxID=1581411 RepID=A0ABT3GBE9_9BACT|nr:heparinase II/III-family protein [Luteolibacter arcticus]MCW1920948.1 heparinase II/III-family protein [Luteolibacter arcticus]